ncbi:MAG: hypothetical protein L0322_11195 [Chloroflexi bacterium]|nr:hypothetical protein [Chloroflexota bacterium]MCI0650174.1 hypothetical protein [Chloroflexota bacterium]
MGVCLWRLEIGEQGIGLYWESYEKSGLNPLTGETAVALRRRVHVELELPLREAYEAFVRGLVNGS